MIIVLRGPAAAGKTTISKLLAAKLENAVAINVDELRHWINNASISDTHVRQSIEAAAYTTNYFISKGYHIIVEAVFLHQWELDSFIEIIDISEDGINVFSLIADVEKLYERDQRRVSHHMNDRIFSLYEEFNNSDEKRGIVINNTEISEKEVVDLIWRSIK